MGDGGVERSSALGDSQFHSYLTLMERTFSFLQVQNLHFCVQGTCYIYFVAQIVSAQDIRSSLRSHPNTLYAHTLLSPDTIRCSRLLYLIPVPAVQLTASQRNPGSMYWRKYLGTKIQALNVLIDWNVIASRPFLPLILMLDFSIGLYYTLLPFGFFYQYLQWSKIKIEF